MVAENLLPDVITFAGNGEPTLHPEFAGIIDDTIELRVTNFHQMRKDCSSFECNNDS
jgi:wyosine [tRNA(Phe)-imidazoG37] synthetase (radical SAM superfamily)